MYNLPDEVTIKKLITNELLMINYIIIHYLKFEKISKIS